MPVCLRISRHRCATPPSQSSKNLGLGSPLIDISTVREEFKNAVGSGSGIILWAETDTGCVFAGSALGSKGKQFPAIANEAVEELVRNLNHGGCVDEYMQVWALQTGRNVLIACRTDDHIPGSCRRQVQRRMRPVDSAYKVCPTSPRRVCL